MKSSFGPFLFQFPDRSQLDGWSVWRWGYVQFNNENLESILYHRVSHSFSEKKCYTCTFRRNLSTDLQHTKKTSGI